MLTRRRVYCVLLSCLFVATAAADPPRSEGQVFDSLVDKHPDVTFDGLRKLMPAPDYRSKLTFDPRDANYFKQVVDGLKLTAQEQDMLRQNGVVSLDHGQRYSMGSAYYSIYTTDLPVLITTDSILHAVHRSYDAALKELEISIFLPTLERVLSQAHALIGQTAASDAVRDSDLYLTVARNLLAGAGAPKSGDDQDAWDGTLKVRSGHGQDAAALKLLHMVESLKLQMPGTARTHIYGGARMVDYSQMRPRGHYTEALPLRRYFRSMMWLGRADTGFNVLPSPGIDADRERAAAAVLTHALRASKGMGRLKSLSEIIDFMVGSGDDLSLFHMAELMDGVGMDSVDAATDPRRSKRLAAAIAASEYGQQRIRSQVVVSNPNSPEKARLPVVAQVFGQRFLIDSFVLSKVVFDSIMFKGRKQRRMMPRGLDVMAALGNGEAVTLLKDDLDRFNYGS
ncbi:MAG: hypothetical protein ACI9WU_005201, partial [Myxococcota bacterium]